MQSSTPGTPRAWPSSSRGAPGGAAFTARHPLAFARLRFLRVFTKAKTPRNKIPLECTRPKIRIREKRTAFHGTHRRRVRNACFQRPHHARAPAQGHLQGARQDHQRGPAARHRGGQRRGARHEGVGGRKRRDALHALVPAPHGHHLRKARRLPRPERRRPCHHDLFRQGADPRRAGRVVVSQRRHPRHLRGPRLHGLGPDELRLHQRRGLVHPDGVLLLHRRGAR